MTSKQLPEWGRGQYELVADPFTFHENALWVADEVVTYTSVRVSKDNYTVTDVSVLSIIVKIYQIHVSVKLLYVNFISTGVLCSRPGPIPCPECEYCVPLHEATF